MEFIRFMFFSMIEVVGLMSITLSIFRFKLTNYLWQAIVLNLIMNLESYFLREELTLTPLVPYVNVLLLIIFVTVIVRVPIVWSSLICLIGYTVYALTQISIVAISGNWSYVNELNPNPDKGYVFQFVTGSLFIIVSYVIYKLGIGFAAPFSTFHVKRERNKVLILSTTIMASFGMLLYYREKFVDIAILLLALLYLIYFSMRKEMENNDSNLGAHNSPPSQGSITGNTSKH